MGISKGMAPLKVKEKIGREKWGDKKGAAIMLRRIINSDDTINGAEHCQKYKPTRQSPEATAGTFLQYSYPRQKPALAQWHTYVFIALHTYAFYPRPKCYDDFLFSQPLLCPPVSAFPFLPLSFLDLFITTFNFLASSIANRDSAGESFSHCHLLP